MKTCPQCHKEYEDNLKFCLEDGTALAESEQFEQPTESFTNEAVAAIQPRVASPPSDTVVRPGFQPPPAQGKRTSYLMPLVAGLFGIVILFLAGLGGAGWYFLRAKGDVAVANTQRIEPPPVNTTDGNQSSNMMGVSNTSATNAVSNSSASSQPNTKIDAANGRTPVPQPTRKDETNTRKVDLENPQINREPVPMSKPPVPKTISGGVLNGKAISLPKPPYPPAARAVHAGGSVSVQVLIDENGRVISANAVSGNPLLRGAAESAARGARFSPTMLSGQPVKVSGIITYNFVP
jgi:TonB family protein